MVEGIEDEELMRHYMAGDEAAFRQLYDRYRGRVYGYIVNRVKDPKVADELFQTTFLKLHRFRPKYTPGRLFSAWIFTICRNVVRDHFRVEMRKVPQVTLDEARVNSDGDRVSRKREALEEVLNLLSKRQREAVALRYEEEMEFKDIARVLKISEVNVRQVISRAIRGLREKIVK